MPHRVKAALESTIINLAALVAALGISMLIIELSGAASTEAIRALWDGAFSGRAQIAGTLSKMIPLLLVALGWIVAFSARRVSIGFEGQILIGGAFGTWAGIGLSLPTGVHLVVAVLAGVVGGALWAGIAALLWSRRNVNEIISTLLLNLIAIEIVSWLVRGPFQEATGSFPRSKPIESTARWPVLLERTGLTTDIFLALAMVVVVGFVMRRTTFGYQLRFTGANEETARHGGINTIRVNVVALVLSGALAGLAGASLILGGESRSMSDNFSANYGFEGIVVALLARNNPYATVPAALLFAALRQGRGLMEARVGVPSSIVLITQGLVILLLAAAAIALERRQTARLGTAVAAEAA